MGQTVVFTVSLDNDDVAIEQAESRPPRHPIRDAAGEALRDRRWHLAFVIAFTLPALVAAAMFARTGGPWVTTAFLAAAAFVTPASGAWAAARRHEGPVGARALVAGIAGALLACVQIPGVAWAARHEGWGESGAVATVTVIALAGAAGALLGVALGASRVRGATWIAPAVVAGLAFAPIGLYGALLPTTTVTEPITDYAFAAVYNVGRPIFVCSKQEVVVTRDHTEAIAWIAFASPIAWAVDAPNFSPAELVNAGDGTLVQAQAWTRSTRAGPDPFMGHCYAPTSLGVPTSVREARYEGVAPLGTDLASAALVAAMALAAVTGLRSRSRSANQ